LAYFQSKLELNLKKAELEKNLKSVKEIFVVSVFFFCFALKVGFQKHKSSQDKVSIESRLVL